MSSEIHNNVPITKHQTTESQCVTTTDHTLMALGRIEIQVLCQERHTKAVYI